MIARIMVFAGLLLSLAGVEARAMPLANYRMVVDLASEMEDRGGLGGIGRARMVTEFTGSACEGYKTQTRLVTEGTDERGDEQTNDQTSTTVESTEGGMDFTNRTYTNGVPGDFSQGFAQRGPDGIAIQLDEPVRKRFTIPAEVAFPTEQIQRVIEAGVAGKRFVTMQIYDGSSDGELVMSTSTVIGPGSKDDADLRDREIMAKSGFAGLRHWPVTIAYYLGDSSGTDESPFFTIESTLYENGVVADIRMDYGVFALTGTITRFDVLKAKPCEP